MGSRGAAGECARVSPRHKGVVGRTGGGRIYQDSCRDVGTYSRDGGVSPYESVLLEKPFTCGRVVSDPSRVSHVDLGPVQGGSTPLRLRSPVGVEEV